MLGIDPDTGISALRVWIAAGAAAMLSALIVLPMVRPQLSHGVSPALRIGTLVACTVLGATIAWILSATGSSDGRDAERRIFLDAKLQVLLTQSLAPGSPFACLDALTADDVQIACEAAIFASPPSVAAATSYVATQLSLLAALNANAARGGADLDQARASLRRSLETDRFGFVAHVLKVRDGCGAGDCKSLALLRDSSRVRDHLALGTFDRYLEHYQAVWAKSAETVAEAPPSNPTGPPPSHKPVNIDFPSAASIPAVNIMVPEPSGPVLPGAAAAAAANPNPSAAGQAARRAHKTAAGTPSTTEQAQPPQQAAPSSAPTQINPPAASGGIAAHAQ